MKRLKATTVRSFFLMIEATFIFAGLCLGETTKVGMGCYWFLIATYHLTDFLLGYLTDGKDDADGGTADDGKSDD